MSTDNKIVQTSLPPADYERLKAVAEQEGKPLKEVLREAARAYTDAHMAPDPEDPLFTATVPDGDGDPVSAADADEYLYSDGAE